MSTLRRALAVVLNLLLLQLSVVGSGAACTRAPTSGSMHGSTHGSTHDNVEGGAVEESHDATTGHASHVGTADAGRTSTNASGAAVADRQEQPAHGSPRNAQHCAAAAGCGSMALASAEPALSSVQRVRTDAAPTRADAPRALAAAPEPPPPRG